MSRIKDLIKKLCPNGVEYKSLKDVFELFSGMTGVSNKWADEGNCRFIDYMNAYKNNKIDITKLPYATVKNTKQTTLIQGDLLLTSASEVPDECAIASVIEDKIQDGIFMDDHLFGLRLKDEYKNIINTTFINYYLNSNPFRCNLFKAVRGVTRFYISNKDYMKLSIPIPPVEVQKEIVRILDKFGELEARKGQYEFWRGKVISNSAGRDGKLIELLSGPVTDGPHTTPQLVSEGIPFISASAVHEGKIHLEDAQGFITKEFDAECSRKYKPKKWDVYMVKSGSTTGKVAIVDIDDDFNIWSPLAAMRTDNEITSRYLYHLLQTKDIQDQVQNRMSHGSQPNLSMRVLEQFDVKIPSLYEQKRIVGILDKFDDLVNDISVGLPAEIELRRQQYEYYRNKLLSFEELSVSE